MTWWMNTASYSLTHTSTTSVFDDCPSTCSRNRCLIDRPSLPQNTMEQDLAQAQWTQEERLLAIYEAEEEQQAYEQDAMQYMYQ
jgi:hypothetical protein